MKLLRSKHRRVYFEAGDGKKKKKTFEQESTAPPSDDGSTVAPGAETIAWHEFIASATDSQIGERFGREIFRICEKRAELCSKYCLLAVLAPQDSISNYTADRIFQALDQNNKARDKDVLLILLSPGGSIEPAYQISKLCKAHSKTNFTVVVPRRAKSAATLIALGADEIHMGILGQLGPIDPQLGGLPALGVVQALRRIAALAELHPGSSEMFARYLRLVLTVEQIGYCERIGESAVQYAQRLLGSKKSLARDAAEIAQRLVYEYKDHSFVIDYEEASMLLGNSWVKNESPLLELAEEVYGLFETVDLFLNVLVNKHLFQVGSLLATPMIFANKKQ